MARSRAWTRNSFARISPATFDGFELYQMAPGSTVIRTILAWNAVHVEATSVGNPAGSTITKIGLMIAPESQPISSLPSPITQPNADWLSLCTLPWTTTQSESTNIIWTNNCNTGVLGVNSQGQRKVPPGGGDYSLYIIWESLLGADADPSFAFTPVGTVDAYWEGP